jgi:hypothetical protein
MLVQNQPDNIKTMICNQSAVASYDEWKKKLEDHTATIELFNQALTVHLQWPTTDCMVKQNIYANIHLPHLASQMLKTGWSMTLMLHEIDTDYDSYQSCSKDDEEDPFQIINDKMSSEKTDSDQMTVDSNSPTLLSMDHRS